MIENAKLTVESARKLHTDCLNYTRQTSLEELLQTRKEVDYVRRHMGNIAQILEREMKWRDETHFKENS